MPKPWTNEAKDRLLLLRAPSGGWGYRPGGGLAVEPTALAALALLASGAPASDPTSQSAARAAADWLVAIQQRDGSLGISATHAEPGWPTPYAVLLWGALGEYLPQRRQAVAWLLARQGLIRQQEADSPLGQDTTLRGWPWVDDTYAWVEPTALAVLGLRREGLGAHERTLDGLRLIRDRAIPSGGWNYGAAVVFGRELRPHPAPTGLALLALAGTTEAGPIIERSINYLEAALPAIRSPQSLGWGLLGLTAWGRRPGPYAAWLAESYEHTLRHGERPAQLAYLLLAAEPHSLELLGIEQRIEQP